MGWECSNDEWCVPDEIIYGLVSATYTKAGQTEDNLNQYQEKQTKII